MLSGRTLARRNSTNLNDSLGFSDKYTKVITICFFLYKRVASELYTSNMSLNSNPTLDGINEGVKVSKNV